MATAQTGQAGSLSHYLRPLRRCVKAVKRLHKWLRRLNLSRRNWFEGHRNRAKRRPKPPEARRRSKKGRRNRTEGRRRSPDRRRNPMAGRRKAGGRASRVEDRRRGSAAGCCEPAAGRRGSKIAVATGRKPVADRRTGGAERRKVVADGEMAAQAGGGNLSRLFPFRGGSG